MTTDLSTQIITAATNPHHRDSVETTFLSLPRPVASFVCAKCAQPKHNETYGSDE